MEEGVSPARARAPSRPYPPLHHDLTIFWPGFIPRARAMSSASPWERACEKSRASRKDCLVVVVGATLVGSFPPFLGGDGGAAAAARLLPPKRDFLAAGAGGLCVGGGGAGVCVRRGEERRGGVNAGAAPDAAAGAPPFFFRQAPLSASCAAAICAALLNLDCHRTPALVAGEGLGGRGQGGERETRSLRFFFFFSLPSHHQHSRFQDGGLAPEEGGGGGGSTDATGQGGDGHRARVCVVG